MTIDHVIQRMERLLEELAGTEMYSFLSLYYEVTLQAKEDGTNEKFIIEFAKMYLEPLEAHLGNRTGKKIPRHWQLYFTHCQRPSFPFLRMVHGIHAHINGDLRFVVRRVKIHRSEYFGVNRILLDITRRRRYPIIGCMIVLLWRYIAWRKGGGR